MFHWFSKKSKLIPVRYQILKDHLKKHNIPIINIDHWDIALTHISCSDNTHDTSYERLEFLGDSVLGLSLASILYENYDNLSEGKMSMLKSNLADEKTLSDIGYKLELLDIINLGRGEKLSDKRAQEKVLCDVVESTIGVIFLESGFPKCREFVNDLFKDRISETMDVGVKDFKTLLQKISVRVYKEYPIYEVIDTEGPDHSKIFVVRGMVMDFKATGKGRSKKEAEQAVAENILNLMVEHIQNNPCSCLAQEYYNFQNKG